jgi:hypothetical protein
MRFATQAPDARAVDATQRSEQCINQIVAARRTESWPPRHRRDVSTRRGGLHPTHWLIYAQVTRMAWNDAATCKVCFVRHGQSEWNAKNLFTGWADVPLTILGKNEAAAGATWIWKEGLEFDVAYTSELKRAQQTLKLVMDITGQNDLTVHKSWRLNERMYGALQGLNKKETVMKYGC